MPSFRTRLTIELAVYAIACVSVTILAAFEIQVWLFFGWMRFLAVNVPSMRWDGEAWATGIVSWSLLVGAIHGMGALLYNRSEGEATRTWKWRWSIGIVLAVALLFASGLAFTGIWESIIALRKDPSS